MVIPECEDRQVAEWSTGPFLSKTPRPIPPATSLINVDDGLDALIDFGTCQVHFIGVDDLPPETVEHYLYDLVYPRLLARSDKLVLHAGAVHADAGALCFVGPSGMGKSTLTASLHMAGLPILTDDAVALVTDAGTCAVQRLYPSLRLFPDSIEALTADWGETSVMAHYSSKRRVSFDAGPASANLAAIFRIREPAVEDEIVVRRLGPAAACMAIIENSFAFDPEDRQESRSRFKNVSQFAAMVPVFDLTYPRDYAALPRVHARIFDAIGMDPSDFVPR